MKTRRFELCRNQIDNEQWGVYDNETDKVATFGDEEFGATSVVYDLNEDPNGARMWSWEESRGEWE